MIALCIISTIVFIWLTIISVKDIIKSFKGNIRQRYYELEDYTVGWIVMTILILIILSYYLENKYNLI